MATTTEATTARTGSGRSPQDVPRLMPEGIAQIAEDHDDYVRLLRRFGYLL